MADSSRSIAARAHSVVWSLRQYEYPQALDTMISNAMMITAWSLCIYSYLKMKSKHPRIESRIWDGL